MRLRICVLAIGLLACSKTVEPVDDLGISSYDVRESATELHVRGLGPDGAVIAELSLRRGQVQDLETGFAGLGRELSVTIGDSELRHQSVGLAPLRLPKAGRATPQTESFLASPRVTAALARWDVSIVDVALDSVATGEAAYSACSFSGCASSSTLECCANGLSMEYRVCSAAIPTLTERHCPGIPDCTVDGTYPNCMEGPPDCPANSYLCAGNTLCCSDYCPPAQVGAAGCALCYQTYNYAGSWNVEDYGSYCGTYECGGDDQECCNGDTCHNNHSCDGGTCPSCSGEGEGCFNSYDCCGGLWCNPQHQCSYE